MAEPNIPTPEDWRRLTGTDAWDHIRQVLEMPGGAILARLMIDLEDPRLNPGEAAEAALKDGMLAEDIGRLLLNRPHQHGQLWGAWAGARRFDPEAPLAGVSLSHHKGSVVHRDLMVRQGDAFVAEAWRAWWASNPADLQQPWADPLGALRTAEGTPQPLHGLAWSLWHEQDRAAEVWWEHRGQLPPSALDEAWVALTARLMIKNTGSGSPLRWRDGPPDLDVIKWATRLLDAGACPNQPFRMDVGLADVCVLRPDVLEKKPAVGPWPWGVSGRPRPAPTGAGVGTTTLHVWMAATQYRDMGDKQRADVWDSVLTRLPWSEAIPDENGRTCADVAIELDRHTFDQGDRYHRALQSLLAEAGAWCPTVHSARWMWQTFMPYMHDEPFGADVHRRTRWRLFEFWRHHATPLIDAATYLKETDQIAHQHPPGEPMPGDSWWSKEAALWRVWLAPELRDHWDAYVAAAQTPAQPFSSTEEKTAWQTRLDLFKRLTFNGTPLAEPAPRPRM